LNGRLVRAAFSAVKASPQADPVSVRVYLYLILDVHSRKFAGFEVHQRKDADHAAHLLKRTALPEGLHTMAHKPVLHGGNGSTLKASTVLAMLHWMGVKPSYSRQCVSDDNAFVESLFRRGKYCPEFPNRGFADLRQARAWARQFVHWYRHEHHHSANGYVSLAQRHGRIMRARTLTSWAPATSCTARLASAIGGAGQAPRATASVAATMR